ncbi:HotDog domain-containing protein [Hyaloraphidium curvatum]|nr:HotDog domain-containing protein [Hyaloraphidium curvatum]
MSGKRTWFNRFLESDRGHGGEGQGEPGVAEVTMGHSMLEEVLPFASDRDLLEDVVDTRGNLRLDLLLEDLDSFAAAVGYRHCDPDPAVERSPDVTIVTAGVSALKYQLRPKSLQDVLMRGFVSYVGRSSFEVTVRICSKNGKEVFVEGLFQMVALHPATNKPVPVNRLRLETDEERRLFAEGKGRAKAAKEARAKSLLASETPPTPEETLLLHELYLEVRRYENPQGTDPALEQFRVVGEGRTARPEDVRYIGETWLDNTVMTQPQDRNVHFKIFGGHLMRLGYELAWAVGTLFSRDRMNFLAMSDVEFRRAIEIGSLLALGGHVTYVSPTRRSFFVRVVVDVVNPRSGERHNSNSFHICFYARPERRADGSEAPVLPRILPRTYDEMVLYLDSKRRWEAARAAAEATGVDDMSRW